MPIDTVSAQTRPQTRAALRAQKKAQGFDRCVNIQTDRSVEMLRRLWPNIGQEVDAIVRQYIEAWIRQRPIRSVDKNQTAIHEAAHYVSFEAEGKFATFAEIYGSPGRHGGWAGSANCMEAPLFEGVRGRTYYSATDIRSEAVTTLVGPAAEQLIAHGDFYSSSSEVIQTCFLAARMAEMQGLSVKQALIDILKRVAALIDEHRGAIEDVAAIIARRRKISRFDRAVENVLARVRSLPPDRLYKPELNRFVELATLIDETPICLPDLVRRLCHDSAR